MELDRIITVQLSFATHQQICVKIRIKRAQSSDQKKQLNS